MGIEKINKFQIINKQPQPAQQVDCLQYNALDVKKIVLTFGLKQSIF